MHWTNLGGDLVRFVRIRTRLSRALRFLRSAQGHIECQFWPSWDALTSGISWRIRSLWQGRVAILLELPFLAAAPIQLRRD